MAEVIETSSEEKAAQAAEDLAAEGLAVTAAAVRERSGVRMATAASAAKEWKARANRVDSQVVDPVPERLLARFQASIDAAWREARAQAKAEFDEARSGWEVKLTAAEGEVAKLTAAVEELEAEHERAESTAAARIAEVETALEQATRAAAVAEKRAGTAEGIAAGLREALTTLKPTTD